MNRNHYKNSYWIFLCFLIGFGFSLNSAVDFSIDIPEELSKQIEQWNREEDILFLRNGEILQGKINLLPPIQYPFGSIQCALDEVSSFACNAQHIQYVTFNGQNFIGFLPSSTLSFSQKKPIPTAERKEKFTYIEKELPFQEITSGFLRKRRKIAPLIGKEIFSLFLKGGDRFPIHIDTYEIHLERDDQPLSLPMHRVQFLSADEVVAKGWANQEGFDQKISPTMIQDEFLHVRMAKDQQPLTIPWEYIEKIMQDRGKSILSYPYTFQYTFSTHTEMILVPGGKFLFGQATNPYLEEFSFHKDLVNKDDEKKFAENLIHYALQQRLLDGELPEGNERTFFVALSEFYIDEYEVTNREYAEFLSATNHRAPPHWIDRQIPEGLDDHPVVNVSHADAEAYARWKGKRLPTEVEWERAAKGNLSTLYPYGEEYHPQWSNVQGKRTKPVGFYKKKVQGKLAIPVQDMSGNIAEWTATGFRDLAEISSPEELLIENRNTPYKVVRGGSFVSTPEVATTVHRKFLHREDFNPHTGFRCAKDALH